MLRISLLNAPLLLLVASFVAAQEVVDLATRTDVLRIEAEEEGDRLGISADSCDVNGDGIDDLLIGTDEASGLGNAKLRVGEAYVIYGRRGRWAQQTTIDQIRDIRIIGQDAFDHLGITARCGDINGDGYGDLILSADNARSVGNARVQAGECHIVFGAPSMPSVIDLAQNPDTILWGARTPDTLDCQSLGDVNGDGILDIVASADNADSKDGQIGDIGKLHIVFGRTNWPTELDLASESDVTILGPIKFPLGDVFASRVGSGDIDGDSFAEVIATARLGDGPNDSRENAGDVYVFRGRPLWPPEIDLDVESPDMYIYGADAGDQAGQLDAIRVGDRDGDGSAELILGARLADGPANDASNTGESRSIEPGSALPPIVDLAVDNDTVIYGVDPGDQFSTRVRLGDVNGDGLVDFVADARTGDGPDGMRPESGEIIVLFGRSPWPSHVDLSVDAADVLIYAPFETDKQGLRAVSDLNGDGYEEIVSTTSIDGLGRMPTVWVTSPIDSDGDGLTNLEDNCPLVANADQADGDGDLVGDACQTDYDGDGIADGEDCAPNKADGGPPGDIDGLKFEFGSRSTFTWNSAPFADRYDTSRGRLSELDSGAYGSCQNARDPDLTDTRFVDEDEPPAADGFFYLTRGRNDLCEIAGSYGPGVAGAERINDDPNACP